MNIQIVKYINSLDKTEKEYVIIDNGDGSQTSMLKSTYDAMQAEQSTPEVPLA
jgi:hypothetical protein